MRKIVLASNNAKKIIMASLKPVFVLPEVSSP